MYLNLAVAQLLLLIHVAGYSDICLAIPEAPVPNLSLMKHDNYWSYAIGDKRYPIGRVSLSDEYSFAGRLDHWWTMTFPELHYESPPWGGGKNWRINGPFPPDDIYQQSPRSLNLDEILIESNLR